MRKSRATSLAHDLYAEIHAATEGLKGKQFPMRQYQNDPARFVREQLGEEPLPHQIDILESVRDNPKTAVASGQKTGKTKDVIWLALWHYSCFDDARAFMLAAIKDQVKRVLWKELTSTLRKAKAKTGFDVGLDPSSNPATGLVASDGREILGFTARDVEALAGLSGRVLFIVDEASAMSAPTSEAIEGNMAGGGQMIWISNPTRTNGPFYEVFNNPDKGKFWKLFHLSSEEVAEYCHKHNLKIPGVANYETIKMWEEEWGRDSPFFIVRVLGKFLRNETGRIFTLGDIEDAQARWEDADDTGELTVGCDPAGPGHGGDEFAVSLVRGMKLLALFTWRGLTEDAAEEHLRGLIKTHRRGDEIPRLIIDSEGPIGSSLYYRMRAIGDALKTKRPGDAFDTFGVRASGKAYRKPAQYDRLRDEIWANGVEWLRGGGAIPSDHKLEQELHAPMWIGGGSEAIKVTPKDELRETLGRSPDRADSFLLAVWDPLSTPRERDYGPEADAAPAHQGAQFAREAQVMNPYGGGSFGRGGSFDPYAR